VALLVVSAHLPLLIQHLLRLSRHPAYGCMPWGLMAALFLVHRQRAGLHVRGGVVRWTAWALCAWLQWTAVVLWSPWLSIVSGLLTAGVMLIGRGCRSLWQLWMLMWLLLPLPLGWDLELTGGLQELASRAASRLLDGLAVDHCRMGYLIEVPGYRYVVEAGCSGMNSIYALVLLAGLYASWRQSSGLRFCGLLIACVCWALIVNAARIATLVAVNEWWHWDVWIRGWHGLSGLVVVAVVMSVVLSTNSLFTFVSSAVQDTDVYCQDSCSATEPMLAAGAVAPCADRGSRGPLWLIVLTLIPHVLSLGLQLAVWIAGSRVAQPGDADSSQEVVAFAADDLRCSQPDDWTQIGFHAATDASLGTEAALGTDAALGRTQHSRYSWSYQFAAGTAVVTIDYPYAGWHDLVSCYRARGWRCSGRQRIWQSAAGRGAVTEVALCRGASAPALLLFTQFPLDGSPRPVTRIADGRLDRLVQQLRVRWDRSRWSPTLQLQMFVRSRHHMDHKQRQMLRRCFRKFAEQVGVRLAAGSGRPAGWASPSASNAGGVHGLQ